MSENQSSFRYGNFEVLARPDGSAELLGGGSFGKTYKARHVFLDQIVALKVISEKFAHDGNAKERFLREARVVHGLRHDHIAQVLDFGEANGTLYYAMEYCEGGSLEELVRRTGPLDPDTVLLLARQLAEALECSHGRGFIHRDVKPANVMLADRSDTLVLKLVDFGLVKPLVQDHEHMASLTLDGQNFFTPLFASPEQVMEEELDARSDLFSLGMTLWYLLKGAAPETGSTAVVMAKRLNPDSYQPVLPPTVPPRLRYVLQKLLEKEKVNRFASAPDVLTAIRSDGPVPTLPDPATPGSDPSATLAFDAAPAHGRLADKYLIAEKSGRSSIGNIYRATRAGDGVPLSVTVLDDALRENPERLERLRTAVALVARCSHPAISQVYGLETFDDAEVLVREWNVGVSLQNIVKNRGSLPFAEALTPLRQVAAGVDFAALAGLPGVRLAPDEIFLQPADGSLEFTDPAALPTANLRQWPPFRIRLTPILLEDEAAQDVSMTLSDQAAGSLRTEFGSLLYRLVAGMQSKFSARVNRGAYIRTAGLSEEGNWILSGCIVDEMPGGEDCAGVLQALQRTEGVSDSDHGTAGTVREPAATTGPALNTATTGGARRAGPSAFATVTRPKPPAPAFPTPPVERTASPLPTIATQNVHRATTVPPRPDMPPAATSSAYASPVARTTPPAAPPPASVVPVSPPVVGADRGTLELPARPLPWVPIVVALGVALAVLGGAAFFLLKPGPSAENRYQSNRQTPLPSPSVKVDTPLPTSTPTTKPTLATPKPEPSPTPTPTPAAFALRNGARFPEARFEIDGRTVTPEHRGGDFIFPLANLAAPGDLIVTVPGYKPVRMNAAPDSSAELPAAMTRETAPVNLAFKSREADYAFIVFSFTGTLPGENVPPPGELTFSLKTISLPARLDLPTGKYGYTLYGPEGQQDTHILPIKGSVTVTAQGRVEVPVPATFAGRFRGEFILDDVAHTRVVRTFTIQPGLNEGTCDDKRYRGAKPPAESVDNVPLADISLDAAGVFHAHIRYAGHPNPNVHNYDEVFELRRDDAGTLVMTGGRETMPSDPVLRSKLEEKFRKAGKVAPRGNRPNETEMRAVD